MATSPTGNLGKIMHGLRLIIADTTAVRTWFGAANQAQALTKIHYLQLPAPANGERHTVAEQEAYRPFALIGLAEEAYSSQAIDGVGPFTFQRPMSLVVMAEDDVDSGDVDNPTEAFLKFVNNWDALIAGIESLAGSTADYPRFKMIEYGDEDLTRSHPREFNAIGDCFRARATVSWDGA